ncbi:LytR/AlgR family response regulator transcription factor [Rufibacter aurantiacus]|uniref:LytR/AlgR family response regulator transcription factor n=1 Tax=Rufibacter aurantiacus TaxID=2817374 RepID=UPI001B30DA4F|nr:LytTR family DNA-binding domain-containing protein [Rufibacter aurantiacus]
MSQLMKPMVSESIPAKPLPVYRDKWIQLVGIPVITLFVQYLTYNYIRLTWMLAYELVSDAAKIWVVWQVFKVLLRKLDQKLPWSRGFLPRLLVQVGISCVVCLAVLTGLVWLDYALVRPYPLEHFFSLDLVLALIFILFINAIYIGLYYYDALQAKPLLAPTPAPDMPSGPAAPEVFLVKLGKREVLLPYQEILCVYSEDKETFLLTTAGKLYPLDSSLEKVMTQLTAPLFFRVNRKYILSLQAVAMVQPEDNGKLAVSLKPFPRLPEQLTISRDRAPAFRQWLKAHHSSLK